MKGQGKNQSFAREINNRIILELFTERDWSSSELAEHSGLSKTAIAKILEEFKNDRLLVMSEVQTKVPYGRQPVYFTINPNFGHIVAIDFSNLQIKIVLADLKGDVIRYLHIPQVPVVTEDVLKDVIARTKELGKEVKSPVLEVCVSAPGKIEKGTGRVFMTDTFVGLSGLRLKDIISSSLDTSHVHINNDINLIMLFEHAKGRLKAFENAFLLNIDTGMGGALLLNNVLYEGERGFAGEAGLMQVRDNGQHIALNDFASLGNIQDYFESKRGQSFTPEQLIDIYLDGSDAEIVDHIDRTAVQVGLSLRNVLELLDCRNIMVRGMVNALGERYHNIIRQEVSKVNAECKLIFGSDVSDASVRGAILTGIDSYLTRYIASKTK